MKKLITAILVLCLLLPAAALASDPIVGCWYIYVDLVAHPEARATYGNYDTIADLYFFDESGTITALEGLITGGACSPTFTGAGKWEKSGDGYTVSIIGIGETSMTVSGNEAYLRIPNMQMNISMVLRRLIPFDMYSDYKY